ncbi:MAG: hypothetical protein AAB433_23370, partial [Nitrospirota bacterium]
MREVGATPFRHRSHPIRYGAVCTLISLLRPVYSPTTLVSVEGGHALISGRRIQVATVLGFCCGLF